MVTINGKNTKKSETSKWHEKKYKNVKQELFNHWPQQKNDVKTFFSCAYILQQVGNINLILNKGQEIM